MNFIGNSSNESITGSNGADMLEGRDGSDTLQGMDGNDQLIATYSSRGFNFSGFDLVCTKKIVEIIHSGIIILNTKKSHLCS